MGRGKCVFFLSSHELVDRVLDGVNGFVLHDEENIAATLALLKKDPERLHKIGKAAVKTWETNFRVEDLALRIRDIAGCAAAGEFPKRVPDRSYAAWIKCFDTVGEREHIAIRRHLRALRRHPLISIGTACLQSSIRSARSGNQVRARSYLRVLGALYS